MKYTKAQRLDIGRRIYDGELTRYEAAEEYEISDETARNYMRQYRDANRLPPKRGTQSSCGLAKNERECIIVCVKAKFVDTVRARSGHPIGGFIPTWQNAK